MRMLFAVVSLLPALLLSQGPEFAAQYQQRLGGAIDELAAVVRHFEEDSSRSGYDRQAALQLMTRNPERLVQDLGARMEENIARLDRLQSQQFLFNRGISLSSLVGFAFSYDKPLFDKTWEAYAPGLPLSFLGLFMLIIGWCGSYIALVAIDLLLSSYTRAKA
jgi:hypothetical protein